jgi:fluoride exporter
MPIGLAVALAGSLGASARYALDYYAGNRMEPHHQVYVTFLINIAGSFLLGTVIGAHPDGRVRIILGVGFLGSFTTFSTLVAQVYHHLDRAQYANAVLLPLLSVVVGVVAVYAGILAGRQLT